MLALVQSSTLVGIDAVPIDVECVISQGQLPSFNIVGLPTAAVKEGAVRVRSALLSVGHEVPSKKVTVNLAPADLRSLIAQMLSKKASLRPGMLDVLEQLVATSSRVS